MTPKDITNAAESLARKLEAERLPHIAQFVRNFTAEALELAKASRRDALRECLALAHDSETIGQIKSAIVVKIWEMGE